MQTTIGARVHDVVVGGTLQIYAFLKYIIIFTFSDLQDERQQSYPPTLESTTNSTNRQSSSPPPSGESQKPPFGCGCGKCTFFTFIERGCPNPIPTSSSFPYLDLSRLTHEQ